MRSYIRHGFPDISSLPDVGPMRTDFRLAGKVYGPHNAGGNRRVMRSDGLIPAQCVLVIGLGYVGLPLAVAAARSGFRVTGLDINPATVAGLMSGRSHVDDVSDAEIAEILAGEVPGYG